MQWGKGRRGPLGLARGLLARVARKGGRRVIHRESLLHRDRGHKVIALTVHRAQEARRPPPLPQRLTLSLIGTCSPREWRMVEETRNVFQG